MVEAPDAQDSACFILKQDQDGERTPTTQRTKGLMLKSRLPVQKNDQQRNTTHPPHKEKEGALKDQEKEADGRDSSFFFSTVNKKNCGCP